MNQFLDLCMMTNRRLSESIGQSPELSEVRTSNPAMMQKRYIAQVPR
jgi:hypothetical protein